MGSPVLSISFHNFWEGFVPHRFYLVRELATRYDVRIEKAGRDIQVSSVFGTRPLPTVPERPLRVWWTGEAQDPKAALFDVYLGFTPSSILGPRWLRVPNWLGYIDWWDPVSPMAIGTLTGARGGPRKERFCTFVATNNPTIRTEFFLRIRRSPAGRQPRALPQQPRPFPARPTSLLAALGEARFNIAFENQIAPGYVTEKLLNPLFVGSVPIHWGAPEALADFNPAAFVNARDFANFDDLIRHVIALDDSPDAVAEMAAAPAFPGNVVRYELTPAFSVDRIVALLSAGGAARVPLPWIEKLGKAKVRWDPLPIRIARKIMRPFPAARARLGKLYRGMR